MKRLALGLLVLAGACASSHAPRFHSRLHEYYEVVRPVTVALRVDPADEPYGEALAEALYRRLIDKGYSVLAPGAPVGSEAGIFRAEVDTDESPWDAEATFEDATGLTIYAMEVEEVEGGLGDLADALLLDLPAK